MDRTDTQAEWKDRLRAVREANNSAAWAMSEYIDETPDGITAGLLREADPDRVLPEEALYGALMAGLSGISDEDRAVSGYFMESVRHLDTSAYSDNPYLRKIQFPDTGQGHWKFTHYRYRPYEAFIRDDIKVEPDTREIPQTGYFSGTFRYPAVEQDGREWMAVKPSEIETMRHHLDIISGKVVTFGLGLGYFAFMASEKPEVSHIDVIERDEEVISLFSKHILPQFPYREKVRIIRSDAFDYLSGPQMEAEKYDYAFADLWHDTSDGLPLYLRLKKMEAALHRTGMETAFLYWVERSLLSAYRWTMFDHILETSRDEAEALDRLSDDALRMTAGGTD